MISGEGVRITMVSKQDAETILDPTKPIRNLKLIAKDIEEIENKGHMAVNLDDARKLESLGLELIRHARETLSACY